MAFGQVDSTVEDVSEELQQVGMETSADSWGRLLGLAPLGSMYGLLKYSNYIKLDQISILL